MTYTEKLRDPRWQRLRLEIMQRDEFKCVLCGNPNETLEVHHKMYVKLEYPWSYPKEWLCTLCSTCHDKVGWLTRRFGWIISHPEGQRLIPFLSEFEKSVKAPWLCPKCQDGSRKDVNGSNTKCIKCGHLYDPLKPSNGE